MHGFQRYAYQTNDIFKHLCMCDNFRNASRVDLWDLLDQNMEDSVLVLYVKNIRIIKNLQQLPVILFGQII